MAQQIDVDTPDQDELASVDAEVAEVAEVDGQPEAEFASFAVLRDWRRGGQLPGQLDLTDAFAEGEELR